MLHDDLRLVAIDGSAVALHPEYYGALLGRGFVLRFGPADFVTGTASLLK